MLSGAHRASQGAGVGTQAGLAPSPCYPMGHRSAGSFSRTCAAGPGERRNPFKRIYIYTYIHMYIFFYYNIFLYLTLQSRQSILTCTLKILSFSPCRVSWKISPLSLESKYEIIVYFSLDLFAFLFLKIPFEQRGLLENKGTLLDESEANFYFGSNGNKVNITIA